MCRVFGHCLHGEFIDSELGDLVEANDAASASSAAGKHFLYCRYNQSFTDEQQEQSRKLSKSSRAFDLADVASMPLLEKIGRDYADEHVRIEHLPDWGPGLGRQVLRSDGSVGEAVRIETDGD